MSSPRVNVTVRQQEKIGDLASQIGCMTGGFSPSCHQLGRAALDLGLAVIEQRLATGQAKHGAAGFAQIVSDAQAHAALPQGELSSAELDEVRASLRKALRTDTAAT